jgi:hypothetical protein
LRLTGASNASGAQESRPYDEERDADEIVKGLEMTVMREIRCGKPEHTNKAIQVFYTPVEGHTGLQEFRCPYCNGREQWSMLPGRISQVLFNGPDWQVHNLPQENSFDYLELFKNEALCRGFTRIIRDEDGAQEVSLKDWQGFSTHVSGTVYTMVIYNLEGNKLRVNKTLYGDYWYTLS